MHPASARVNRKEFERTLLEKRPLATLRGCRRVRFQEVRRADKLERHRRDHVFQGRYKSIPVNASDNEPRYFRIAADYIGSVLNSTPCRPAPDLLGSGHVCIEMA